MPERKIVKNKITEILREISLNINFDINNSVNLKDDFGLDSLGLINLVLELNNIFNIEIKSREIVPENFETIGRLEDFILKKLSDRA